MKLIHLLIIKLILCSCVSSLAEVKDVGFYIPVEKKTEKSVLVKCSPPGKKSNVVFNAEKIQIGKIKRLHVMQADEENKWIIQFVLSVNPTTKPLVFIHEGKMYGVSQDKANPVKEKNANPSVATTYVVNVESKKTALEIKNYYLAGGHKQVKERGQYREGSVRE